MSHGPAGALTMVSMGSLVRLLRKHVVDVFERTGFCDLVGGRAEVEEGLDELQTMALPLVGELLKAQRERVEMAEAVLDPDRFHHLAQFHGWLDDALRMQLPTELADWVKKIVALAPSFDAPSLHRSLSMLTFARATATERTLARLIVFELLCMDARLRAIASGSRHGVLGLERGQVERIADEEIRRAETQVEYREALVGLEGGVLGFLSATTLARLDAVVELVREEVATWVDTLGRAVALRNELVRALRHLDPAEAVLVRNAAAPAYGEERLSARQLKVLHPVLLQDLPSEAAARKRLERTKRHLSTPPGPLERPPTLGDLLAAAIGEVRP